MPSPSISTRPHWPIPAPHRRGMATPHKRLLDFFESNHMGLREVVIQALGDTDGGKVLRETIQHLMLNTPAAHLPVEDSDTLARITWLRGERYVREHGEKTQFRFYVIGCDDDGDFRRESRFTVNPEQCLEPDPSEGEDGEPVRQPPLPTTTAAVEDEEDNSPIINDDKALATISTVSPVRDPQPMADYIVRMNAQHSVQLRKAYEEPIRVQEKMLDKYGAQYQAHIADSKAQFDTIVSALTTMMHNMTNFSTKHMEKQDARIESLEKLIGEMFKRDHKQYENLQELARQGWVAFLDAMKMKSDMVDERIAWTRFQSEEIQRYQPAEAPKTESAAMNMVAKGAPIFAAGMAILMRKRGDDQSADFLEDMARRFAGPMDDEDEDEEEAYVDANEVPRPNGRAPDSAYTGQAAGPTHRPAAPGFADRSRTFRDGLSQEQLAAFKKALSKDAWRSFEAACGASNDDVAIVALQKLQAAITSSPAVMMGLSQHLSQAQVKEILGIVADVKKASGQRSAPPQRPGAPA